jgi:hypothetical protein
MENEKMDLKKIAEDTSSIDHLITPKVRYPEVWDLGSPDKHLN